ncbi:AGAP006533-PA-like protein [Anopheles sinensis]|uniref:SURF1-like protein n=1 Tax=Anopheles sinensis TaxID=74873 RepID=A0A084WMM1_ANOSI|nr:AGAP006533-PA-like protein [Anopheles sinensis]
MSKVVHFAPSWISGVRVNGGLTGQRNFGTLWSSIRTIHTRTKPRIPQPPKIRPSQSEQNKGVTRSDGDSSFPSVQLIPATTFGLGCWQVYRKQWKEDLIREMERKIHMEPVPIPENLSELNAMEYETVKVRGEFLHDQELHLGPRACIVHGDSHTTGGLFSQREASIGFLVITPFKLEGRDDKILVNRGWVPKRLLDPATRPEGQVKGTVELEGVVRVQENRPQFTPQQRGAIFMYRDVDRMANLCGTEPYYIDAKASSTVPMGPVGGQTRVTLRNEHLSYIVTWFSLSGFTTWLWFRQVVRGKSF